MKKKKKGKASPSSFKEHLKEKPIPANREANRNLYKFDVFVMGKKF
jgi:hypothetical protein